MTMPAWLQSLRRRWDLLLFLIVLCTLVYRAYAPSLRHVARADQLVYLLDTFDHDSLWDTFAHSYSYNRTRVLCPGDTQLFRPGFFALLAAEKALFGANFALWQGAAIVMHLTVCVLLVLVLRRVQALAEQPHPASPPGRFQAAVLRLVPYAVVLFFALNYSIVEQVIWFNVNGYVLFVIFVLGSLLALLHAVGRNGISQRRQTICLTLGWLLALLAAFTYEIGQFYAVLAGCLAAYIHLREKRVGRAFASLLAFGAILGIYQGVNRVDQHLNHSGYVHDVVYQEIWEHIDSEESVEHLNRYLSFAIVQPFMPWNCSSKMLGIGKIWQAEQVWNDELTLDETMHVSLIVFSLWAVAGVLGLCRLAPHWRSVPLAATLLFVGIFVVHAATIVLGRMNLRPGPTQLGLNPYYTYISLLFVLAASVPALSALIGTRGRMFGAARAGLVAVLLLGLTIVGLGGSVRVHELNVQGAEVFRSVRHWNQPLLRFVQQHRGEPDFSFALALHPADGVPELMGVPYAYFLHERYLDCVQPKYVVWWEDSHLHSMLGADWLREHEEERERLCPDLVLVRTIHHVFRSNDGYFAVPHGPTVRNFLYSMNRQDFPGVIQAESLDEVLEQIEPIERMRRFQQKQHLRKRLATLAANSP